MRTNDIFHLRRLYSIGRHFDEFALSSHDINVAFVVGLPEIAGIDVFAAPAWTVFQVLLPSARDLGKIKDNLPDLSRSKLLAVIAQHSHWKRSRSWPTASGTSERL